jgi:hypothetical protein
MTTPDPQTHISSTSETEQRAKQDVSGGVQKVQHDVEAATGRAAKDAEALKYNAEEQIKRATQQAKSFAADQKNFAAEQISGVASAISKVADELEEEQATTARYARDLARGLDRFGNTVNGKSVEELMGLAQSFGRSQPLAFLGAAALAGFMASRFAGASAQRRQGHSSATSRDGTAPPDPTYGRPSAGGDEGTGSGSAYGQSSNDFSGGGNVSG